MHHVPAATVEYSSGTLKEIIPNRSSMFFVLIKFSKFCYGRRVKIPVLWCCANNREKLTSKAINGTLLKIFSCAL